MEAALSKFSFPVRDSYTYPDPNYPTWQRTGFICAVEDLPAELPLAPNPRDPRTDGRVYKELCASLLNKEGGSPNIFMQKNLGITIVADGIWQAAGGLCRLDFKDGHGILNGGTTYRAILDTRAAIEKNNKDPHKAPIRQFVQVSVVTGVPKEDIPLVAKGLGTSKQVELMSIINAEGGFDWVKTELGGMLYFPKIGFSETQGEMKVKDIIAIMELFHIFKYPNEGGYKQKHPLRGYCQKTAVLVDYRANIASYRKFRPLVKNFLTLRDTIDWDACTKYAGLVPDFIEKGESEFLFLGKKGQGQLTKGALYPILAAFRSMIQVSPKTGALEWCGGFEEVLLLWKQIAKELLASSRDQVPVVDKKKKKLGVADALGKTRSHWHTLYTIVVARNALKAHS